jgi:hypothetical protein
MTIFRKISRTITIAASSISFVVMQKYSIDSALTSDEDFEQAGFQRLMDPGPQGVREPGARPYGVTGPDFAPALITCGIL